MISNPTIAYLSLSRPFANLSLSPPDVRIFIAPRIRLNPAKKIAIMTKTIIPTAIILLSIPVPPVGTPVGRSVVSIGEIPGIVSVSFID